MPFVDRRSRLVALSAVLGTASALALAGCSGTSSTADPSSSSGPSTVNVTLSAGSDGDECAADTTTAKAGPVTFSVTNESATGIIEFELLQDQRIVGEKENLAPGLAPVEFTVTLDGGTYQLYCPGASKELTDFTVTGKAAAAATGDTADLLTDGATGYAGYVSDRLADLLDGSKQLQAAIDAGDLDKAKTVYAGTRQFYEKVESDVSGFIKPGSDPTDNAGNLDYLIDMRASNLDPEVGWHGFHAIERDLFQSGKITDDTKKLAAELVENVTTLNDLSGDLTFKPEDLANGAAGLLEEVQSNKITGEEEAYSHIDLVDLASNVEGARQAFAYLEPGLKKLNADLTDQITAQFANVDDVLATYRDANALGGYVSYDDATKKAAANTISQAVQALQDPLSQLAQKVAAAS
ncbi:EfeM/EfeO family lipoprotein [Microbacterium protaetiae]|uniref:EfeM/EfeO family lipoprotein n=1 Tax=Microbacterium protaetiae TaxID=2509458 RepID=A0A4P6ENN2_9MICO|nr:iron uptake system protein EfeO [Microbacterium protaetiae]QAY59498.1 EfeM/EfeO family lipoprotein [Microbacterium protaetiae]